ncbi:MAG: hypothetical protein RBG13Loki_1036 [Promethearchaeota archaeon CR_4]|nr:MAG: hypothetical protein RBG13Loki_1036 [Candidatus Lokiarchaeota archaeon CR_4]
MISARIMSKILMILFLLTVLLSYVPMQAGEEMQVRIISYTFPARPLLSGNAFWIAIGAVSCYVVRGGDFIVLIVILGVTIGISVGVGEISTHRINVRIEQALKEIRDLLWEVLAVREIFGHDERKQVTPGEDTCKTRVTIFDDTERKING